MNPKSSDPKPKPSQRSQLLRELFLNACSLALLKQLVLIPAPVPVRVERRERIPEYYRG